MDSRCNDACVSLQDEQQWRRERDAREKQKLDSRFVIQTLPAPSDDKVKSAVENGEGGLKGFVDNYLKPENITLGHRVLVMDEADRNLLQIYQQERPNLNVVRVYMQELLEALGHLHSKGLAHCDVKALNIVRLARDNRLRLIDLDAAVRIVEEGHPVCFHSSNHHKCLVESMSDNHPERHLVVNILPSSLCPFKCHVFIQMIGKPTSS